MEREQAGPHSRPHELHLGREAFDRYREYRRAIEPALVDDEDALSAFPAWGNKLPGQMLRIAAVLHLMEQAEVGSDRPWETDVHADTIERAIAIAEYFRAHTTRLFVRRPQVRERIALDWLREHGEREFSPRDLFRSKHRKFENMEEVHETLRSLEQMGWIRSQVRPTNGRPATRYIVNPHVWQTDGEAAAGQAQDQEEEDWSRGSGSPGGGPDTQAPHTTAGVAS